MARLEKPVLQASLLHQRLECGTPADAKHLQSEVREDPVLSHQRNHIGDGPQGHQIEVAEQNLPFVGSVMPAHQSLEDLEGHPHGRHIRKGIGIVGAARVHQSERRRQA